MVSRLKKKPFHLISTLKRPVPLNHYAYVDDKLHLILDHNGHFDEKSYREYYSEYRELTHDLNYRPVNMLTPFIDYLKKHNLTPAIFFVFSRKKCQTFAERVQTSLTSAQEAAQIGHEIDRYLAQHNVEKDKLDKMPQIIKARSLLVKGIGVHHSGLIPLLKEITEILFSQGLVKVLFATETFAVGVNMPTRTVIFTELTKFCDGNDYPRLLRPDEYLQMSGRAGRRGIDKHGTVVHLPLKDAIEPSEIKNLILGKSPRIESKFKVNYTFVLQMLYSNQGDASQMTHQSYLFQQYLGTVKQIKCNIAEKQAECQQYELDISNSGLGKQIIGKIHRLISLEEKLKQPEDMGNGFVVRLSRKQMKKSQTDIRKLKNELYKTPGINQVKSLLEQKSNCEKQLKVLHSDVEYYGKTLTCQYEQCLAQLRHLGYINYHDNDKVYDLLRENLTDRGLIASQIASANEILLTELIIDGRLQNLDLPSMAGVLSIFCEDSHKSHNDEDKPKKEASRDTYEIVRWIGFLSEKYKGMYTIYEWELSERDINHSFVEVAYLWARGDDYFDLLPKLSTFEGNFIRNMLRLTHICDELIKICEIYQDSLLQKKAQDLKSVLLRDIVSFDSLYLK